MRMRARTHARTTAPARRPAAPVFVALLLASTSAPALASTQILSSPRVRVVADQEQQGPSEGFLTLRVHAENLTGRAQRVTVRFESRPSAEVFADLELAGAERRTVDLLIPAYARYGSLVADDGHDRGSEGFSWHWQSHDPILLEGPTAGAELVARGKSPDGSPTSFPAAVAVAREQLPASLASLVGYAAVGLLETPFEDLPEPQRRALEAYAATGGELFLSRVPGRPEASLPLWRGARAEGPRPYGLGHVHLYQDAARCVDALRAVGDLRRPVIAPSGSPYGRASYGPSGAAEPLIEVARVPVGGFLALVLAFVFVIGPGSFLVRARRGPAALMLFVPLTALATCGGIAGYGVLHEGVFTVHAASRTVTFLDAEHHRAASLSVDGFYASLAPSVVRYGALATPIPPQNNAGDELRLDLTSGLAFAGGFIPSRTYREHLDAAVAPARARLSVRGSGAQVTVENALGAKVVDGAVKVGGRVCLFYGLADGASSAASCSEEAVPAALLDRLRAAVQDRFALDRLADTAFAPLEEGEFLVSLDRAVFAPDLGVAVHREGDRQLVRGRVAP